MNIILLITIVITFSNGITSHEVREIEGNFSAQQCEFFAEIARREAMARNVPDLVVTTTCDTRGNLDAE